MYWNFYLILTKVFDFCPFLFWMLHVVIVILAVKLPKKPGSLCFLIPGVLFAFHDIRWEALNGPFHCNWFFVIIELILMIIGSVIAIVGGTGVHKLLNLLTSFIQGYALGIICIFALVWFVDSIAILAILLILAFVATAIFSE